MIIHNCHTHIFTTRAVPAEFLPLGLVRVLSRRRCSRLLGRFLNWLNPFRSRGLFDRYGAFVEIGGSASQREIFERLLGYYPFDERLGEVYASAEGCAFLSGERCRAFARQSEPGVAGWPSQVRASRASSHGLVSSRRLPGVEPAPQPQT